jgi:hypothetical protein
MPRRWPDADRIRVLGALDPPPINGIMRGVAVAVEDGRLPMDEAIDFVNDITVDKLGSPKVWRYALAGLRGSVRRREMTAGEVLRFLVTAARGKHPDYRGINYVRVTGTRDGEKVVSIRRLPVSGPGTAWESMAAGTGAATAAFMLLATRDVTGVAGVLSPEDWAEPERFYAAMARTGDSPLHEVVEAIVTPSTALTGRREPAHAGDPA